MEQARLDELLMIEQEYKQLKALLDYAAKGGDLDKYAGEMLLFVDPESLQILDASLTTLEFLGYSASELQALKIDDIETKIKEAMSVFENNQPFEVYEAIYRHKEGFQLRLKVRSRQVKPLDKTMLRYALEDKSLHRELWRELSRREDSDFQFREQLKTLYEINLELGKLNSLDDICRRSIELGMERLGFDRLSIWFINRSIKRMLGSFGVDERGEIRDERGQSWSYHGGDTEEFLAGRREPIIVSETPLYNERSQYVGYGWHVSVPLLDGDEFIGFMGVDNHINKQAMKAWQPDLLRLFGATVGHLVARQREQDTVRKLSSAIQHSASMILILNKYEQIEFANDAFLKHTHFELDDILRQEAKSFFPQVRDWQGEITLAKKSGESFPALATISGVYSGDSLENYVIVLEDISLFKQNKEREMQLALEQERLRLLGSFVGDIGHEFKTPLTLIKTSNYFLAMSLDESKRRNHSQRVEDSVEYLNHLLTVMLDMVRLDSSPELKWSLLRLDQMISDILNRLQREADAKQVQMSFEGQTEFIMQADMQLLWRAVDGLIRNALDYTPTGGTISINLKATDSHYQISVADTGMGIPADELEKIFQRFYRVDKARSSRNAGLGLTIARRIAELHGGEIRVESTLGVGSRFEMLLPKH